MKNFNFKAVAALCAALALVSCGKTASVKGTVADAPESEVIVKLLDVNRYEVLDTVATGKDGSFSYKVEIKKNEPEFIYLFYKETKIASSSSAEVTRSMSLLILWGHSPCPVPPRRKN